MNLVHPFAHPFPEAERQRAVDRSTILQRRSDDALQRLVRAAADAYGVPMAAITVIDRSRQWFAARVGIKREETTRDESFCAHAIHRPGEPLVVNDATKDDRFRNNPFVTGETGLRFYAGMPIVDNGGYALGALCVLDTQPRDDIDTSELTRLAREVERLICP